jgi:hypothetical protein
MRRFWPYVEVFLVVIAAISGVAAYFYFLDPR